jgi:pyridoxine kinase
MGDGGKLYSGMTAGNIIAMEQLCQKADVLIPNVTEACLLCGVAYEKGQDRAWHERLIEILLRKGCGQVVLSGVSRAEGMTGFMTSDGGVYQARQLAGHYHGTGDLFAEVLTGALLGGESLQAAAEKAARFVEACIKSTGEYSRFGIRFEENLQLLTNKIEI